MGRAVPWQALQGWGGWRQGGSAFKSRPAHGGTAALKLRSAPRVEAAATLAAKVCTIHHVASSTLQTQGRCCTPVVHEAPVGQATRSGALGWGAGCQRGDNHAQPGKADEEAGGVAAPAGAQTPHGSPLVGGLGEGGGVLTHSQPRMPTPGMDSEWPLDENSRAPAADAAFTSGPAAWRRAGQPLPRRGPCTAVRWWLRQLTAGPAAARRVIAADSWSRPSSSACVASRCPIEFAALFVILPPPRRAGPYLPREVQTMMCSGCACILVGLEYQQ